MKLTNAVMAEHLKGTKPKKVRDDAVQGFYARFNGRGRADFIMRYRSLITSKETTFVLGVYGQESGQLSVLAARDEAKIIRVEIDAGHDPHISQKKDVTEKRNIHKRYGGKSTNIEALTKLYINFIKSQITQATLDEKQAAMTRICDFVGDKNFADFDKTQVLELLNLTEVRGNSAAMKLISHGSAFSNWVLEENKAIGVNPWLNLKGRKKRYKSSAKTRLLDDDELKVFIAEVYPEFHPIIRRASLVSLYTNCRPGMATQSQYDPYGMDWSEIKWDRREWNLVGERMKNKIPFNVPLSDQFYTLLREWWEADGKPESGPITPALSNAKKYMEGTMYAKKFKKAGLTYTPHDLRRTVSTHLKNFGCPLEIRDSLRAHLTGTALSRTYDVHDVYDHWDSRIEWMQKWADHLDTLGFANLAMKSKQNRLQIEIVNHG